MSGLSVPVPEESPFFVVFLCKKAFCKPLLYLFLWRGRKFVIASNNMQDPIQISIVFKLFVWCHGVTMGTKKLVARIYP